jgi:hypothetical protein
MFVVLFTGLVLSMEVGHRLGVIRGERCSERMKEQLGSVQSGVIGVLGLLLGFAFSAALARFEVRRELVVEEANAIGTAYLRTDLLPEPENAEAARLLRHYADQRVRAFELRADLAGWAAATRETRRLQAELWRVSRRAVKKDGRAILAQYISAINAVFDLHASSVAALSSHVPPLIVEALLLYSLLSLGTMVFVSGARGGGRLAEWWIMALLVSTLLVLIADLDRPRLGHIPVDHEAIYLQRDAMRAD